MRYLLQNFISASNKFKKTPKHPEAFSEASWDVCSLKHLEVFSEIFGGVLWNIRRLSLKHLKVFCKASGGVLWNIRRCSLKHPEAFSETSEGVLWNIRGCSLKHQEVFSETSGGVLWNIRRCSLKHPEVFSKTSGGVPWNGCSEKFCETQRKAVALEFLFNKVSNLQRIRAK